MKKLYVLFFIVILCVCILSSCELLGHRHIAGEWQYSGENHWRAVSCTWNMCDIEPLVENHVDGDKNDICDLCGSKHEHIFGEWHFDETYHWCTANCTWNGCDIDTAAEHFDKNDDAICDVCGYNIGQISKNVAQIVVDYENALQDEINRLREEYPEYIYYYHPVDEVHCIHTR